MSAVSAPAQAPVRDENQGEKPEKVERIPYLMDEELFPIPEGFDGDWEGGPKLTSPEQPANFDRYKHKTLSKSDFASEIVYLEFRARDYEARAAKLRAEIETVKKLGNAADRAKAKKLMSMQQRMAELAKELSEDGTVDLASILGADQAAALLGNGKQDS